MKERKSVNLSTKLSYYKTIVIISKAQIHIQFSSQKHIPLKEYVSVEVYSRFVLLINKEITLSHFTINFAKHGNEEPEKN